MSLNLVSNDSNLIMFTSEATSGTIKERMRIDNSGNVGIGTTTPTTQLQATNSSDNATSTMEIGKTGQNKGSCLKMYDAVGTVKYVSIQGNSFVISDTSCQ